MSTLGQLNYLLNKKTKRTLCLLFFLLIGVSIAELLGITVVLPVIELAMETKSIDDSNFAKLIMQFTGASTKESVIIWMIVLIILIYITKSIYICFVYNKQFRFSASVKRDLATRLMKSYLKQPYSFFLYKNTSELIRSVNTDTGQLFQLITNVLSLFSNMLTALFIITYLAITNFWMTLTVAVILGLVLFVVIFLLQKKNRKNGIINQQLNGFLIKHLKQAFEGVKEIKLLNTENEFISLYDENYKKSTEMEVKYSRYNTLPKYLIEVFAVIAILSYLGFSIVCNPNYMKIMPQLAVFCVAAFKLLPSVNAIYSSYNVVVYHKSSIDLVYRDIKEADNLNASFDDESIKDAYIDFEKEIELKNISFRYENTDVNVLNQISFVIPKGKSVAFIGPSGGGKTTMADLILSLLTPTEGNVLVDGVDIQTNIWGWRKKLGYIPQNIYLIDDTIRKNVAFGIPEEQINDSIIWRALEDAQLKEFVENLPNGLDTVVGERGARISGGQRQRIGIARSLYRNPEVLVFDEATSALDNETEKEVMKAIDALQGTKTIIMIAHRLSTIEKCDMVFKVEKGHIIRER